jgi:hypothetical protein
MVIVGFIVINQFVVWFLRVDYLGREKQGDLSTVFIDNFYWITNDVKNISIKNLKPLF